MAGLRLRLLLRSRRGFFFFCLVSPPRRLREGGRFLLSTHYVLLHPDHEEHIAEKLEVEVENTPLIPCLSLSVAHLFLPPVSIPTPPQYVIIQ